MKTLLRYGLAITSLIAVFACAPETAPMPDLMGERAAVERVLSALHRTAAAGDWETYFGLYRPDAVFFGTDATERWNLEEFRGYASGSKGWTYDMTERHVFVSDDGNTAWFDERLHNASYGETRGTGVLVKSGAQWRVAQYNLTIPIPNDLAAEFTQRIKGADGQ